MKTEIFRVDEEFPDLEAVRRCAHIIRQGGAVIVPTETVYGLAVDGHNPRAVARLRTLKQRPDDKPFPLQIATKSAFEHYADIDNPAVYKIIDAFWPGPLTVVVPSLEGEKVGLRMPDHNVALRLIREAHTSLAVPSANPSDQPPPVDCAQALAYFDGKVEAALDAGPVRYGRSSTVIEADAGGWRILREGPITKNDVDEVIRRKVILFICTGNSCRSVMAEYLLKEKLRGRDDVEVISAGTSVFISAGASAETLAVLRRRGIDASGHQSRPIDPILLKKADLILVMTRSHRWQVLDRVPEVEQRVYLLREFVRDPAVANMDIPDPMGQPPEAYERCCAVIDQAVSRLAQLV